MFVGKNGIKPGFVNKITISNITAITTVLFEAGEYAVRIDERFYTLGGEKAGYDRPAAASDAVHRYRAGFLIPFKVQGYPGSLLRRAGIRGKGEDRAVGGG